jgi:ribosomal protein S18 acetylase RimI-like enzyme
VIRPARRADAAALARVQLRSWHRAYADIVDPELLAEHTVASREERWRELLAPGEGRRVTLVFEQDGQLAGFVSVRDGEVAALYVDPPAQGAGVGTELLAAAEEALRGEGCAEAFLSVLVENGLARAFYEARGWRPAPDSEREDRWGRELRYRKRL